ncbi:DUF664 domain-containing protein [Nonomuraea sp. NPDC047897]|uniref:mycothiol transferase n=1 Tax=Nonomuraea sp. NPDC047897 TaxID=3364346 RepID=UPI0037240FC6
MGGRREGHARRLPELAAPDADLKCSELDPQALAQRSVPFSGLSLLVWHLADVVRRWFRRDMAGRTVDLHFSTEDSPDAAFDDAVPGAEAWRLWQEEVDFADRFVAETPTLEVTGTDHWRGTITLRWVMVHMVEEYAPHNDHADFLRQGIDGDCLRVGPGRAARVYALSRRWKARVAAVRRAAHIAQ